MVEEKEVVDLFICHSSIDKPWVEALAERVEGEEWQGRRLKVFFDKWDIGPGDNVILKLDDALAGCRFLGIAMSPEMLTSEWCKAEYSSLLVQDPTNRRGRILPMRVRDTHSQTGERLRVPPFLGSLHHLDFRQSKQFTKEFGRLLAKLRGEPPPRGRTGRATRPTSPAVVVPALPERPDEPDQVSEVLLSNLLPIMSLPKTIWSCSTRLRAKTEIPRGVNLPPFLLREERLFTFQNLADGTTSPFKDFVSSTTARPDTAVAWQADSAKWRWYTELLNLCLRSHLRPEAHFDPEHQRFWFVPKLNSTKSVQVRWGSGSKRTVVRAPEDGRQQNWVHHAARLNFETIGKSVFLAINPTYVFTTDGRAPVPKDVAGPLVTQWAGRERNKSILGHVLLWADFVTRGKKVVYISAGDQSVAISRLPATVETPVGLASDHVQTKALLSFSDAADDAELSTFAVVEEEQSNGDGGTDAP
jgi:hypothetical protein